jgi:hypothetical protein
MRFAYLGTLSPSSALKSRASNAMMKEKSRAGVNDPFWDRYAPELRKSNKGLYYLGMHSTANCKPY